MLGYHGNVVGTFSPESGCVYAVSPSSVSLIHSNFIRYEKMKIFIEFLLCKGRRQKGELWFVIALTRFTLGVTGDAFADDIAGFSHWLMSFVLL